MIISYEDLQFWSVTTDRDPFLSAYKEAKKIYESGATPVINWRIGRIIDVTREGSEGEIIEPEFKNFKQRNKKKLAKKKPKR